MDDKKMKSINIEEVKQKELERFYNDDNVSLCSENINVSQSPLDYLKKNYLHDLKKMLISDIFYSKTFDSFNNFCKKNNIDSIDNFTEDKFNAFLSEIENISSRRKLEFKIMNTFEEIATGLSEDFFELEYLNKYHKDLIIKTNIEDVFEGRKFMLFNNFCEENSIKKIVDLKTSDLVRFSFKKSVGYKKKEEVKNRIEEFLYEILGYAEEECIYTYLKRTHPSDLREVEIDEIFKEYKYTLFRIYCYNNEIATLLDLDVDSQRRFFNKFEIKEPLKKMILNVLKKEYLYIIKKNAVLSKIVSEERFTLEDNVQKDIEKNYFKLESIDSILPDKYIAYRGMKEKLKEDGVENILDIMTYDISKLKKVSGVGEKRYSEFKDYLDNKIHECREIVKIIKNDSFILNDKIYKIVKEKTIIELTIALNLKDDKKSYNLDEISKYQGVKYSDLDDYGLIKKLIVIKKDLEEIVNINETVKKLNIQDYTEIEKKILNYKIIGKKSLEDSAKELGISVEYLLKHEKKIVKNINKVLEDRKFLIALKVLYSDYRNMNMERLYNYLDVEDYVIIDIIKANIVKGIFYISETDTMSYFQICTIMNNPKNEIDKAPTFGEISYIKEVLNKYKEIKIDDKTFAKLLKETEYSKILSENGLNLVDNYYYKENISKIGLLEMYLKYYHKSPLRINKESVDEVNNFFKEKFGIDIKINDRSLEGLASRSEKILLVDPRTYSHIDYVCIDEVTILHMKKILDLRLSKKSCINAKEVYDIMKDYYPDEFYSKHHVYSLINFYFDEYSTSRGNSLDIAKKGQKILSKTDVIYDICKENGSIIKISDLKEQTGWSMNRIYNAIDNSSKVIKLGPSKCVIIEDILKNSVKQKIKKISKDAFESGYAFTNTIYQEYILGDEELKDFISTYDIKHAKEIASLIKYVNGEIVGNNNFLYKKDQKITCLEDVIKIRYKEYLSRKELRKFLSNCGYSQISIYQTMDRIVSKNIYVQIDKEDYVVKEKFVVDNEVSKKVLEYVNNIVKETGYFIPNKHIHSMSDMIKFDKYKLNQFTVANILEENGYRRLFRYKMKNDMDVIVLVKNDSPYKNIDQLAHDIIKDKYSGSMKEKHVYDFLSEVGIYEKTEDVLFKKMYNDMNISGCIKVDSEGIVSLHGKMV